MNRRTKIVAWVSLTALTVVLLSGFYAVLEKRFVDGGVYPHYASFRSDPLGCSALYESLDRLEDRLVSRNLTKLGSIRGLDGDTTLLLLGYPFGQFSDFRLSDDSPLMEAVAEGARLVLAINPGLVPEVYQPEQSEKEEGWLERRRKLRESREPSPDKGPDSEKTDSEKEAELEQQMREALGPVFDERFEVGVTSPSYEQRPEEGWVTEAGEALTSLGSVPATPLWRSPYRLDPQSPDWRVAVHVEGAPVVLERSYGKGTVVIATDAYFATNESLHFGAETDFLLWLLGDKTKIVFDETIHGSRVTGGAMSLIRRYRAHGIFYGLIVLIGLWAWRSASPLVSGSEEAERGLVHEGAVAGQEIGSGFIRLLRRSIAPRFLLETCVQTWKASAGAKAPPSAQAIVDEVLTRHRRDPKQCHAVVAYREIVERLRKR